MNQNKNIFKEVFLMLNFLHAKTDTNENDFKKTTSYSFDNVEKKNSIKKDRTRIILFLIIVIVLTPVLIFTLHILLVNPTFFDNLLSAIFLSLLICIYNFSICYLSHLVYQKIKKNL